MIKETAKEFKKDGTVGSQLEADGAIGGTVQQVAEEGAPSGELLLRLLRFG